MAFNWTGAIGGLLGEYGNQIGVLAERKAEMEREKLKQDIADRKEMALMMRQERLEKLQYDKMDQQERIASMKEDKRDARDAANREADAALLDKRLGAYAARSGGGDGDGKPSADERKLQMIENDPNLSPEEKAAARKQLYGIGDKAKGGLNEYQAMQAEQALAEIEVTDDVSMKQANAIRKRLGMPVLKKVETDPGRGGILGIGAKDPVYDYVEDYGDTGEEPPATKPAAEPSKAEDGKPSLLNKADQILGKGNNVNEKGQSGMTNEQLDQSIDALGTMKDKKGSNSSDVSASTDLGTVLGDAAKAVVAAGKGTKSALEKLAEINSYLEERKASAPPEDAAAIENMLAKIKGVLTAEVDPVAELNRNKVKSGR